jgi:glycosyltransferase involved in cell wall biosynthesis
MPSLLMVTDGPIENAPARLRAYQYGDLWRRAGFNVEILDCGPYTRRVDSDFVSDRIREADLVFIQRNMDDDVLDAAKQFNKPVVFDFDDAIFYVRSSQILASRQQASVREISLRWYRRIFRGHPLYSGKKRQLNKALSMAAAVVAGNEYLAGYARKFNNNVFVVPTSVDVSAAPAKQHTEHVPVVIGWIGVSHNFIHLDHISSALGKVAEHFGDDVVLKVVSSQPYPASQISVTNKKWKLEEEPLDVASFDIGIMPLLNDIFAEGKCSFKAILCMSHGVPVVVSDVGMNRSAIRHGETGFLAKSDNDWVTSLRTLIQDTARRRAMGAAAREDMKRRYSVDAVFPTLLTVANSVLPKAEGRYVEAGR